jgi:hypothetical protein
MGRAASPDFTVAKQPMVGCCSESERQTARLQYGFWHVAAGRRGHQGVHCAKRAATHRCVFRSRSHHESDLIPS